MVDVFAHGIACMSRIGVSAEERAKEQELIVDVTATIDRGLESADDIGATLDYTWIITRVREVALERERKLLETLAEDIAAAIKARASGARVRIVKPSVKSATVGVEIAR